MGVENPSPRSFSGGMIYTLVIWLMYSCEMTHSCVKWKWNEMTWKEHVMKWKCEMKVWNDSSISVKWLINKCDMTHLCVRRDSLICLTWFIYSYVWRIMSFGSCEVVRFSVWTSNVPFQFRTFALNFECSVFPSWLGFRVPFERGNTRRTKNYTLCIIILFIIIVFFSSSLASPVPLLYACVWIQRDIHTCIYICNIYIYIERDKCACT